jgi:hypothetical protein
MFLGDINIGSLDYRLQESCLYFSLRCELCSCGTCVKTLKKEQLVDRSARTHARTRI